MHHIKLFRPAQDYDILPYPALIPSIVLVLVSVSGMAVLVTPVWWIIPMLFALAILWTGVVFAVGSRHEESKLSFRTREIWHKYKALSDESRAHITLTVESLKQISEDRDSLDNLQHELHKLRKIEDENRRLEVRLGLDGINRDVIGSIKSAQDYQKAYTQALEEL